MMKKFDKKIKYLALLTCLVGAISAFSQTISQPMGAGATISINNQLQHIFGQTNSPSPDYHALYDLSAHYSDYVWWTNNKTDTSNNANFTTIFDELYYSHYDTTSTPKINSFWDPGFNFLGDTVVVALIDHNFLKLKNDAFGDSTYFYVDTLANPVQLVDNPNRLSSPYHEKNLFMVCAMQEFSSSGNLIYRIDPAFLLIDNYNNQQYYQNPAYEFQLDFGDGNGWVTFNTTTVQHHQVIYQNAGTRHIKAQIVQRTADKDPPPVKYSISYKVAPKNQQIIPDVQPQNWDHLVDELDIDYYEPCTVQGSSPEKKYFIYLSGFDPMEQTSKVHLYANLRRNRLTDIRNYGYGIVVVDWKDSKLSMKKHGEAVIELLDHLKCSAEGDVIHPFVMMGYSMGGVIGRYALSYMEEFPNQSTCRKELMHNTRLFISEDSPHQGAYIPLAFQELYEDVIGNAIHPLSLMPYSVKKKIGLAYDIHNTPAVTQLLKVHSQTNIGSAYFSHPNRLLFMNQLQALANDGWPRHCKLVGISKGLLSGQHQLGANETCIARPGDDYADIVASANVQILGLVLLGGYVNLNLSRTDPGIISSDFYSWSTGINHWGVSIQWDKKTVGWCPFCVKIPYPTGISVGLVSTDIKSFSQACSNGKSYSIMPGGYDNVMPDFNDWSYNASESLFGANLSFLNWTYSWGFNNGSATSCVPDPMFAWDLDLVLLGFNVNSTTMGGNYSFIPTRSALDTDLGWDHNIYAMSTASKMNHTPFDVIAGEFSIQGSGLNYLDSASVSPDPYRAHTQRNLSHGNDSRINDQFGDLDDTVRLGVRGRFLNREVGDRVLMLENLQMNHNAIIEAEMEIFGGSNLNPYYEYPSQQASKRFWFLDGWGLQNNGIFSDANPFITHPMVNLRAAQVHDFGIVGPYNPILIQQVICDHDFIFSRKKSKSMIAQLEESEKEWILYPNPVEEQFTISPSYTPEGQIVISIYSLDGREVMQKEGTLQPNSALQLTLPASLPKGTYLVKIIDQKLGNSFKQTIIKQ